MQLPPRKAVSLLAAFAGLSYYESLAKLFPQVSAVLLEPQRGSTPWTIMGYPSNV